MDKHFSDRLYPKLAEFVIERTSEFAQIPESRRAELDEVAEYIRQKIDSSEPAKLTFICTHNSRRSHLSQIWAMVAADVYDLRGVETFSGGTEATAMNPRVVQSLQRMGFVISSENTESTNPTYVVRYSDAFEPLECFSKLFDQPPNPTSDFAAVMTCSSADQACPVVTGCQLRAPIRYEDPKVADDTPQEAAAYDERSRQICREMMYAMSKV